MPPVTDAEEAVQMEQPRAVVLVEWLLAGKRQVEPALRLARS